MSLPFDPQKISITKLDHCFREDILSFLAQIFSVEQDIPVNLLPITDNEQEWWGIWYPKSPSEKMIIGTVAAWKSEANQNWHWGRFAIDARFRGYGLGKKLAIKSFSDLFESTKTNIETISINARDKTVNLILTLGGVISGDDVAFHGRITPMTLTKSNFKVRIIG